MKVSGNWILTNRSLQKAKLSNKIYCYQSVQHATRVFCEMSYPNIKVFLFVLGTGNKPKPAKLFCSHRKFWGTQHTVEPQQCYMKWNFSSLTSTLKRKKPLMWDCVKSRYLLLKVPTFTTWQVRLVCCDMIILLRDSSQLSKVFKCVLLVSTGTSCLSEN